MPAEPFKTNPEGGGGNQWNMLFIRTQGQYGMHNTVKGKIVYQKKRHYFTANDLLRIMPQAAKEEVSRDPEGFAWWQKLMNWMGEWMLERIGNVAGFRDTTAKALWNWLNYMWDKLLSKLLPGDYFLENTTRLYKQRLEEAVQVMVDNGDSSLLELLEANLRGE